MNKIRQADSIRPKGTVLVSEAPAVVADVPPVLRRRGGKLFVPVLVPAGRNWRGQFTTDKTTEFREVGEEALLRPGKKLYVSRQHIVVMGRQRTAELIGGVSSDYIDRIAVGDGGIATDTTSTPKVVPDDQTELEHEVTRQLVTQRIISEDGPPSITFVSIFKTSGSFQFAEPGQNKVSEVGLFCRDGVMVAAHNFAPIPVDVNRIGVMVQWEWVVV